jgi:hypothetical protein
MAGIHAVHNRKLLYEELVNGYFSGFERAFAIGFDIQNDASLLAPLPHVECVALITNNDPKGK